MTEQAPDDPASERVGSVLDDKWTLERVLGSGGMGAVYAARHRNGARAAVKLLHADLARRPDVRERFLREGYAANRVEHRGAVQVLDDDIVKSGPDEGTAYLVMEMLDGESLEERLERGPPLTEGELLAILIDVLAVLDSAHGHGVVHRDLKPANLFLNKDPSGFSVKVLDFGLARLVEARSVTSAGLALGTPSFMAPEQANGKKDEIDARTDIFAIGATAFMILSGRGVHEADGVLELVARMGTLPAPKLRDVAPHVSEKVAAIVDRALMFKREDRYSSAALMRADLQSALEELVPSAAAANDVAAAITNVPDAPPKSRSRAPLVLGALVLAGIALVLAVPDARDRALGEMLSAVPSARSATAAMPSAGAAAGGGPSLAAAQPSAPQPSSVPPDAAAADPLAVTNADVSDASAAEDASLDAGDDASADDDDDEDDVDASAAADGPAPTAAAGRPAAPAGPAGKPLPAHAPTAKHAKPAPGGKAARPGRPKKKKKH